MKKLFIALVSILFTAGIFVVPAMARSVFEVNIIRCGAPGAPDVCGPNPAATDPLIKGKVEVDDDGDVKVDLKGAAANATYAVFIGNWFTGTGLSAFAFIGTVTTDIDGDFDGPITTGAGADFVFPSGTSISQPNFAFNNIGGGFTEFTTGFTIP